MGHRLCQNNSLVFDNVRVPEENVFPARKATATSSSARPSHGRARSRRLPQSGSPEPPTNIPSNGPRVNHGRWCSANHVTSTCGLFAVGCGYEDRGCALSLLEIGPIPRSTLSARAMSQAPGRRFSAGRPVSRSYTRARESRASTATIGAIRSRNICVRPCASRSTTQATSACSVVRFTARWPNQFIRPARVRRQQGEPPRRIWKDWTPPLTVVEAGTPPEPHKVAAECASPERAEELRAQRRPRPRRWAVAVGAPDGSGRLLGGL